jgi:hypothetical protein
LLDAHTPLEDATLMAAIGSGSLDSSALKGVLINNSPLSTEVLGAALLRNPPLSASDLTSVLLKQ